MASILLGMLKRFGERRLREVAELGRFVGKVAVKTSVGVAVATATTRVIREASAGRNGEGSWPKWVRSLAKYATLAKYGLEHMSGMVKQRILGNGACLGMGAAAVAAVAAVVICRRRGRGDGADTQR